MHTVIVGGGFAGVKAALELSKRQIGKITLITNQPYFLHHATLYATATGRDSAESVIPLDEIFRSHPGVKIVNDEVTSIDTERKILSSANHQYAYDAAVLALGSVTAFFNIQGMEAHSFGIKTLEDVQEFQEHIYDEIAHKKLDKKIYVIGGGQTGVELAGALYEHINEIVNLKNLKSLRPKITVVEVADRIVPRMSKTASTLITKQLRKLGVNVHTGHHVEKLKDEFITIDGDTFPTRTAIWTSGVKNNPFFIQNSHSFQLDQSGRVVVNAFLEASSGVYVIGDNNNVKFSGTANAALAQGAHVAKNIAHIASKRPQSAFRPHSAPVGVPISSRWGYVEWHGIYAAGRPGLFFRRLLELYGYCQLMPFKRARAVWRAHDIHSPKI